MAGQHLSQWVGLQHPPHRFAATRVIARNQSRTPPQHIPKQDGWTEVIDQVGSKSVPDVREVLGADRQGRGARGKLYRIDGASRYPGENRKVQSRERFGQTLQDSNLVGGFGAAAAEQER